MKKLLSLSLVAVLLVTNLLVPAKAYADGMILPPGPYPIYEAGQKAAIFYQDGTEHLILSVQFTGETQSDFGWVIPTPGKPEVEKGDEAIFRKLADLTVPKKSLLEKIKVEDSYYGIMGGGFGAKSLDMREETTVEVIEEKQVGILDVAVLQAGKVQDLLDWMDENEYKFPESQDYYRVYPKPLRDVGNDMKSSGNSEVPAVPDDEEIMRVVPQSYGGDVDIRKIVKDYIDEDWYFVLTKVSSEFLDDETAPTDDEYYYNQQREVMPLRISFPTVDVVYPLRISAGGMTSQSILLYIFDDHKVRVSNYDYEVGYGYWESAEDNSRFETQYAEKIPSSDIYDLTRTVGKPSWLEPEKDMYLTKLYTSYLGYPDMTEDVLFEDTKDNKSVNAGDMSVWEWVQLPFVFVIYLPYNLVQGFFNFFGYGYYWEGESLTSFLMAIAAFGVSLLFSVMVLLGLRKIKSKIARAVLHVILFPSVWGLGVTVALVFVLPFVFVFKILDINLGVLFLDAILLEGLLSTAFVMLGYKVIGKVKKKV